MAARGVFTYWPVAIERGILGRMRMFLDPRPARLERREAWSRILLCFFTGILGLRAFFIEQFGASVPLVHEWEATGVDTLARWRDGTYTLAALFEPHNGDHPTVATRLWEIFWFVVNGSWDPKLIMFTKAAVFSAAATIFIHLLAGGLSARRISTGCLLAALFAFPFNWHNLLWGVASQFDFLFLMAALGWLALTSGRYLLALACGFLALFTNGAGPIVCASYVPFFAVACRGKTLPRYRAMLLTCAATTVVVFGLSLHTSQAAPHPGTVADKVMTGFKLYAWPFSDWLAVLLRLPESGRFLPSAFVHFPSADQSWLLLTGAWLQNHPVAVVGVTSVVALVLAAPTAGLAFLVCRNRIPRAVAIGPIGVGGFAFLMISATALARADQTLIAVRFLDHVALAGFVALASAVALMNHWPRCRRWVLAWAVVFGVGYASAIVSTLQQVNRKYPEKVLTLMQSYFVAHDRSVLLNNRAYKSLIFEEDPSAFFAMLDGPALQPVVPRSVTKPGSPLTGPAYLAGLFGRWGVAIAFLASTSAAVVVYRSRQKEKLKVRVPIPLLGG